MRVNGGLNFLPHKVKKLSLVCDIYLQNCILYIVNDYVHISKEKTDRFYRLALTGVPITNFDLIFLHSLYTNI
jgi:hypothetical protein